MTFVINYRDRDNTGTPIGGNRFLICADPCFINNRTFDYKAYQDANPDKAVMFVFNIDDNIITATDREREQFELYADMYGFEKSDYRRVFKAYDGKTYRFDGFLPERHKYKCSLMRLETGQRVCTTTKFVKDAIDNTTP